MLCLHAMFICGCRASRARRSRPASAAFISCSLAYAHLVTPQPSTCAAAPTATISPQPSTSVAHPPTTNSCAHLPSACDAAAATSPSAQPLTHSHQWQQHSADTLAAAPTASTAAGCNPDQPTQAS